jgi:hypothetical protein
VDEAMDDRGQFKTVLAAEKADDATAIKVYRAVAKNYRSNGVRMGAAGVIDALCDRLESSNAEIARLRAALALESARLDVADTRPGFGFTPGQIREAADAAMEQTKEG